MKVTALAGGVGGARLASGLARLLTPVDFAVVVNTGDDFIYSGLLVCPDLDTVAYTLAGINDPSNGWGIKNDTRQVLNALEQLGHPIWFSLGDRDIATHIERTRLIALGHSLTETTEFISKKLNVENAILPMTDSVVRTMIETEEYGVIAFQEYFVRHHFQPAVRNIFFDGFENAILSDELQSKIVLSDLIVICPSNPFVSIDPILSIPGIRDLLKEKVLIAVSPLIGGKTVKGPAGKMMIEMGFTPSSLNIAKHYGDLLSGIVIDHLDHDDAELIRRCGIIPLETEILMPNNATQTRLAKEVLEFGNHLINKDH